MGETSHHEPGEESIPTMLDSNQAEPLVGSPEVDSRQLQSLIRENTNLSVCFVMLLEGLILATSVQDVNRVAVNIIETFLVQGA